MGRISVDEDRCKGCKICVEVCPRKVIAPADRFNRHGYRPVAMVVGPADPAETPVGSPPASPGRDGGARCTGCAVCALMCPDVAITVYR